MRADEKNGREGERGERGRGGEGVVAKVEAQEFETTKCRIH